LQSPREVMDELTRPEDPPERTQQLMSAAAKQSDQFLSTSPATVRDFVRKVVRRLMVHSETIDLEVSRHALRSALTDNHLAGSNILTDEQNIEDVIRLELKVRVKRCGGEMRLVVQPSLAGRAPSHPVASLLKAVARGRGWYESVVAGEALGRRSIAKRLGLDERYVARILNCSFLAADIVEAIVDGRQPPDLTLENLRGRLPLNWVEQRKRLGFPARIQAETTSLSACRQPRRCRPA
jgi:site-specific DNA recombinase